MPSSYPRRENIHPRSTGRSRPATRLSGRWVYNYDDQQFAYGTTTASWNWPLTVTDRKNGPGNILSFTLTHSFNPTLINEFVFGAGRGGVTIAPADDKATRTTTGINTPLLYPERQHAQSDPKHHAGRHRQRSQRRQHLGVRDVRPAVRHQQLHRQPDEGDGETTRSSSGSTTSAPRTRATRRTASRATSISPTTPPIRSTPAIPFSNALLGVYNSYTQASTKVIQSYFYQDISGYIQDTWKITPRLTLDLGMRFSYYEPYHNIVGPGELLQPQSVRSRPRPRASYRPVCVGAATCAAGQAAYRALDPADRRPADAWPTRNPATWSENWCRTLET